MKRYKRYELPVRNRIPGGPEVRTSRTLQRSDAAAIPAAVIAVVVALAGLLGPEGEGAVLGLIDATNALWAAGFALFAIAANAIRQLRLAQAGVER